MRWFVLLVTFTACTDFDDVPRNVCGNGLLEAGEDCDESDPRCVRCAVQCSVATDCPSDAYACGVDGFCHAPSGELARPTAPVTFQADDLRVTDIDHDGRGDVVGVSRTSIVVRYGDAAAGLSAVDSFVTPAQSGPASFGDLDGDGSLDVTLVTPDGLVTYASSFGSLSPLDVETPIAEGGTQDVDMLAVHSIAELQFIAFGVADGVLVMLVFDFADEDASTFAVPCLARLGTIPRASFDIERIDLYRAHADGAATRNAIVSFTTTSGAVCTQSIHGSTAGGYTVVDITPPTGTLTKKPILADLDGDSDPCPGLVISDGGPGAMRWFKGRLAGSPARCTFDTTSTNLSNLQGAPGNAVAIGRVPIDPPILLVGADALVTTNGIYGQLGSLMFPMYQSSRPLAKVAHGDLDGDGDIDAAAAAATEDDIDLFLRYTDGVELLRYDTAGRVTTITVGDYDGNGVGDLGYTEAALDHLDMFVAYGTNDRHLAPMQVAAFANVASVTRIEIPDSADNLSVADDLIVVQPSVGNAGATATLLHGSPQRTMLSFLEPRVDANRDASIVRASVVGEFEGSTHPDLMVIAAPYPNQQPLGMRAYRVGGSELGLESSKDAGTIVDGLVDCQLSSGSGACVQNSRYLAWSREGSTDVVIAVDGRSPARAMRVDPGQTAQAIPALVDGLPPGATVQSLYAYDLDGDGPRELVAAFTGSVRLCDVSADGMPSRCDDVAPAIHAVASSTYSCVDAAPGRVGERGLVVLCREGTTSKLFRLTRKDGALAAAEVAQGVALRSLRVSDVTGDGVDDVVAVQGDGSASALVVFPQCTTRDTGACRSSSAAEGGAE